MDDTITTGDLADLLGFSSRYTAELSAKGILVKAGHGKFKTRESIQGYVKHLKERGESGEGEAEYEAAKTRKMVADADRAEIETAKEAGKLVIAKSVGKAWEQAIEVAVAKLMGIGRKVGGVVILERTKDGAAKIIDEAVRAACEEIHTIDIAAIAAAEPAPKPDGGTDGG